MQLLVELHPGWSLAEIKTLTLRERTYWLSMARYQAERRDSLL